MKRKRSSGIPARNSQVQSAAHLEVNRLIAQGDFAAARQAAEGLLQRTPTNPALLHNLGVAFIHMKEIERGARILEQAAKLAPGDARIQNDLGIAYEKSGNPAAAEKAYREALRIAPALGETHGNLADLLFKMDRPGDGIECARFATQTVPSSPFAWHALGDALMIYNRVDEAIEAFEKAVRLTPPQAKSFTALAKAHIRRDRKDEAIAVMEQARILFKDDPKVLNDLGLALGNLERYEEAQQCFEAAYRQLHEPTTLFNILTNLAKMKRFEELVGLTDEVLKHAQPNVALFPLFGEASATCQWSIQERLLPHFLEACTPDNRTLSKTGPSLLLLLPLPTVSPNRIREISEKVAGTYRQKVRHFNINASHAHAMSGGPKLRVGYLSGDFKTHVVNYFISGQLSHYDKQYFEIFCYSSLDPAREDDVTDQYRAAIDRFVRVSDMDSETLVRQITDDGIQVLVDLSGHTAGTLLAAMFHRPAPVQISYLGYPFTTGIEEVDYVLLDPWLNGPNNAESFTEQILEIPHSFLSCGELPAKRQDPEPPFRRNGFITFGSLNNCYKLNRPTVAAWSQILSQVPDSRLVLNNPAYASALTQENVFREFECKGIARERVSIVSGAHPKGRHLYWYEDIDIALDSFPQTGGTTTTEALWMGVPVVTLVGNVQYERLSYSVLNNCGVEVEDLIAFDVESYIERAVALALDKPRIMALHEALLKAVPHSLLFDPARQVRYYEETLIDAWNRRFPQMPKFVSETFVHTRLNTPAAPWIATAADPNNLYRYVVEEQGRWFAPEYTQLKRLSSHFQGLAVEIGAEPGFFSLELASVGMSALSLCTSTVVARQIRAAAEKGGIARRIDIRLESAKTDLLDRAELEDVALLRIGIEANDGNAGPVLKNPIFWSRNAPVVLLSVHNGNQADLSTAEQLTAMGYRLYRMLPGLECFAAHQLDEALDPYTLYLLACPPKRQPALVAAGILVDEPTPIARNDVAGLASAGHAADPEQETDEWVIHCANQAYDFKCESGLRVSYLHLAIEAQQDLMDTAPSTTRRISLARLLSDVGRRAEAVSIFNQVLAEIAEGTAQVTLPFLAPAATWDEIAPGDDVATWLLAAVIETRCRLAAHSTYFLAAHELESIDMLESLCFQTPFSRGSQRARLSRQGQQ